MQITVTGKVENTGFRLFALRKAYELHISGEARQECGCIIIHAEGEDSSLESFLQCCHAGPEASQIKAVEVKEMSLAGYNDFRIL